MGWLIRFIKNRDMAVENMVSCLARQSALQQLPPGVVSSIRDRLHDAGINLPSGSILKQAASLLTDRGSLPGSYNVSVTHTRCSSRRVPKPPPLLTAAVRQLCIDLGVRFRTYDSSLTKAMTGGVRLNGRLYNSGSHVELTSSTHRSHPEMADDASSRKVATIHKFYSVHIDEEEFLFVEVSTHKRVSMHKTVRVVKKRPKSKRRIFSVDSIQSKQKLVPHWDENISDMVCSVHMWDAK